MNTATLRMLAEVYRDRRARDVAQVHIEYLSNGGVRLIDPRLDEQLSQNK